MRLLLRCCALMLGLLPAPLLAASQFIALAYHDVRDTVPASPQVLTLSSHELAAQFAWLRAHGYRPISLDDLLAAREGRKPLPDKAVLLSFDDGYASMYTRVFPLLKLYQYPAVLALVTDWMGRDAQDSIDYVSGTLPRRELLTWEQVREMQQSGLVEIASHSHDLHRGIAANPQGSLQAAVGARHYDAAQHGYESDAGYRERIHADLARSSAIIEARLGRRPRALVWPYGSYTREANDIAGALGMNITLGLSDGVGDAGAVRSIPRYLVRHGADLADVVWLLRQPARPQPLRVAHVDLDYVFDPDAAQQDKNLGSLIERVKALEINTVFLQAYADPDGDGSADALYFPNRHLPLRADLFNYAAHQLRTRAGVKVYAWLPVLAYRLPATHALAGLTVTEERSATAAAHPHYLRLSPFQPAARTLISEIYADLARHSNFDGLLFHDDAYLTEHEDDSLAARNHYQTAWRLPGTPAEIRQSPAAFAAWTQHKTRWLTDFTLQLADTVRAWRPEIRTARNLYAAVILQPEAANRFAQSLPEFLSHYDYTALMAMPYLEGASEPRAWLQQLATHTIAAAATPQALHKIVFELQSVDWNRKAPLDSRELAQAMALLRNAGIINYGYYPDDSIRNHPDIDVIKPGMSLRANPYR